MLSYFHLSFFILLLASFYLMFQVMIMEVSFKTQLLEAQSMERKILNLPVLERQKHHLGHLKERNCLRKNLQNVDSVVFYTDNKLFNTVASAYVPSSQKSSYFCSLLRVSVTLVVSSMLKKPMLP